MRQTAVGEPEVLVESAGIDHQGVTFPFSHSAAVIERVIVIAAHLTLLSAPVHLDDPVVAVAAADQDENPLTLAIFDELHAVGQLELTDSPWRLAVEVRRVVLQESALTRGVQRQRPR